MRMVRRISFYISINEDEGDDDDDNDDDDEFELISWILDVANVILPRS